MVQKTYIPDEFFSEILDLSIIDTLIIQYLLRYSRPVLRFKVLEDINDFFPSSKQLTPTKFYYSLGKLEKLGFIKTQKGIKKRSVLIEKAEKIFDLNNYLLQTMLQSRLNYFDLLTDVISRFSDLHDLTNLNRILVILPPYENKIDPHKLIAMSNFCKELYVLVDDEQYKHYSVRNPDIKIIQTKIYKGKIREANDYFDAVVYIGYSEQLLNEESDNPSIVEEMIRVTKSKGLILLSNISSIDKQNHFLLDALIEDLLQFGFIANTHQKGANEIFELDFIEDRGEFRHNGFVIFWSRKI